MKSFKYSALSRDGIKVNGVMDAIDEFAAIEKIKEDCPIVTKIEEVKTDGIWGILNQDIGSKKVDAKSLSIMCSQFSVIISSGVTIDACLKLIGEQTEDKRLKKMLLSSSEDVAQGTSLATAFEKNYPELPALFVETVRAGELSGTLENSFKNLETYYKRANTVAQKTKQAMSYPLFVLCVAIVVLMIVMVKVMPTLTSVFKDFGGEMPLPTLILISMTEWFQSYWLVLVGILLSIFVIWKLWTSNENGKIRWSEMVLKMPGFGKLQILSASQQFSVSMASLISSGLSVANALKVTAKCIDHAAISREVGSMAEKIETGQALGDVLKSSKYFPQVLKEMTAVGERTGELSKTLDTLGTFYTQETDYETTKFISKLEPTMMIVLAIVAGFIVISIYLPMFTMYNYM